MHTTAQVRRAIGDGHLNKAAMVLRTERLDWCKDGRADDVVQLCGELLEVIPENNSLSQRVDDVRKSTERFHI